MRYSEKFNFTHFDIFGNELNISSWIRNSKNSYGSKNLLRVLSHQNNKICTPHLGLNFTILSEGVVLGFWHFARSPHLPKQWDCNFITSSKTPHLHPHNDILRVKFKNFKVMTEKNKCHEHFWALTILYWFN